MSRVLIIDDEKDIRDVLCESVAVGGHEPTAVESASEALRLLENDTFDIIFSDIKMKKMDGIEFLEKAKTMTDAPIILITGHGDVETAVDAMKKGAFDFFVKPLDLSRILITIRNAAERSKLVSETKILRKKISKKCEITGNSPKIKELLDMIDKVAKTKSRVLILGENGTGKELVARRIHELSNRADGPFIEVNCAAIPSELIESQLFGHKKGSFTGAVSDQTGAFEAANGGTIFLDEIGDMSPAAQAKVLRVLQESKIMRVGEAKETSIDVRVIAATNKNLKDEISKGFFREDLFHRISTFPIQIPPLRERANDIPELIKIFVVNAANDMGKPIPAFTEDAVNELKIQPWTGNIRELQNIVERLVIMCGQTITSEDVRKHINK